MIRFVHPEAFLLLVLAALLLRRSLWPRPLLGALRALLLVLFAALLAQPYRFGSADGRDLVVVLDASRSMPASSRAAAAEFAGEVQRLLEPGDRLALVEFGRRAAVAVQPGALFAWPQTPREVDPEGSDLGQALATAAALVPPGRQGSVLLWSDGEHTAADPEPAARALRRAGLRLDAMAVRQPPGRDVAVADLSAPGEVAIGQPFVLTAFVQSDAPGRARWRLLRDGQPAGEGEVELAAGRTVVQTRQSLREPGVHAFAFEVDAGGDARPANDRGLCAVRAAAPPVVLCVTPGGREDRLTRSLRAAGHAALVAAPGSAPLHLDALDAVRCVVLENVAAQELPAGALAALRTFVRDLGGGLLMTGGEASFGVGGYHRSAVEEVLPVTMEMREEQRRFALAMAIALDRSGSMAMAAGTGTKMDLADSGAAAAVELLSRLDSVAVIAIDSEPHVMVPMTPVTDKGAIAERIRRIDSGGGGIFVDVALEAAARELAAAKPQRRHLVLFADAADAEQPGDYQTFVPKLAAAGVTVSVIGLGRATDSDGPLLQEIAKLGHGRCQFVAEPADLPRVFAQETIQVAKSAMVEEPAALRALSALQLLGDLPRELPAVGGYSLAWLRPLAEQAVVTVDEQHAPLLSFWQCGLGRGAAFLGEADGRFSGGWQSFAGYAQFFGTLVRWLQGGAQQGVFADFRREGDRAVLTVEVEDALAAELDRVRGVVSGPDGGASDVVFERTGATQLRAEVPLRREGVYRAAVQAGGAALRVPPVCLPYSPEYAPRLDPDGGERLLRRLCALTGGRVDPTAAQVVAGDRRAMGRVDLAPICALAALVLLLLEIVVRRFDLRLPVRAFARRRAAAAPATPATSSPTPQPLPAAKAPAGPAAPADGTLAALERARRRRG